MNKIYKTVWNETTRTWVAVPEFAPAQGKSSNGGVSVSSVAGGNAVSRFGFKMLAISASIAIPSIAQVAMAADARISNGSAPWTVAISPSGSDVGGNGSAKATGKRSIAAGWNAKADGENSIALGYDASTETNSATYYRIQNVPDKTMNNIAIGKQARSGGLQTIAFGPESVASKSQSIAFGFDAQATGDQSVALGANTRSVGDSSIAIGGDDLDSVASTVYRVTSPSADNDAYNDTALAKQYRTLTGQNLVNFTPGNRYIGTSTGQAGVAVGVSSKAADLATAVGTKSHATGDYSAALGVGANATLANAVALGAGSTTATNATDVPSATIGAITYGGGTSPFAGSGKVVPGDQVSVGAAGFERQIKHVAPGAITAASTDAINGSQLFYVAKGLQEQITATGGNGIHFYHVNGANTDNNYNNDGATGSKALAAGINAKAAGASSVAVGSAEIAEKSVVGQSNSEGAVAIGDSAYAAGRQAVTLGASRAEEEQAVAIGSNARSSGKASMAIGAGAVASQENSISIGSSANAAGNNSVSIGADSSTVAAAAGSVALGHTSQATRAAIDATKVQANAAPTVANNQVYALASASNADQNNIIATVKGELGAVSVGTQNGTRQIINVAAGTEDSDAVNVAQLKAVANQITTQAIATTPLTVANDGKVTPPAAADAGKLATAGDIANAINNSGFQATAGGRLASGTTATATTVKPGQKVTFAAGNGLTVKQDVDATNGDQTYTYALDAQTVVQNAQTPVVYTKADGTKVYKHTNGNFYDAPNGAGNQVAAGDVIASMQDAAGDTTKPTTLANVKGNLADTSNATGNPSGNDRATLAAGNKGNNAATVNDVLNAGFNVQGNGAAKDFVTHGDTINFVNGQGTVANVTSTNGVTEVKFDTPLSYADAAGNNTTTPSNAINLVGSDPSKPVTLGNVAEGVKDTDAVNVAQLNAAKTKVQAADNSPVTVTGTGSSTDPYKVGVNTVTLAPATGTDTGKVAAPATGDAGKLVTAGDIANAINSSGFKATAGGNTTGAAPTQELIKAGDTLTLKAGSGLTVEQTGSSFTYALNAQQVVQDAQTPVVYTKADGSKVYKHTDGNFYDQPNGAGTQVAAGDVIASMQGADGATTATPATKDPDTGIMIMAGGTTLNNVASAGDITNPDNAYRAVNAGDLNNSVQKLVNNGFKIDADNGTADTVKLGETVKYAGDGNIVTTVSNNQIGFKLANTVTIGSGTGSNPVKIDGTTGNVTGLTNITWDPANTPITSGRAATEDQLLAVANAANSAGAGFTIAGNSKAAGVTTADETIKAGETLSIKGTGAGTFADYDSSNIQTQVGANGEVTVGLKKDLNVNSVTAGNTKVDNSGIAINNPADPSKNVSLTGNGLNNGGNTITNVGDGVNDTDAVNIRQLKAAQTNVNNLTNNVIGTDRPNLTTYDVYGNVADNQNTVVDAIKKMNTGGIKFFHVNDGTGSQSTAGTLSHPEDSAAKGAYGAAVGYQAKADGENSVALGKGAEATGKNSISIGTGNIVTGIGSGAIGDPTTITGNGTYTIGNNNGVVSANEAGAFGNNNTLTGDNSRIVGNSNTVTTTDTFVMGNNSTSNVANSVVLGSNASANAAATASSAGTTTYASSVINGTTYNYAGATPTGVVSVGDVGAERRVQNVAAGLISADSTDAINGSQLYATNSAINALQTGGAGIVQYSNGNAAPNGGTPTNHVTLVGGDSNAPVTIHNVAAGVAPTDAVNVSQLQGVAGQINKVADEADAGTAAAMAAAGLPQAYLPGKSMVAVSGSTYRGKQGYAVGFSAINDGGNWIVKGIATGNSKGKFGATIGAGYQW
nr:YadA-like family protein [uncultured Kingella sp.]